MSTSTVSWLLPPRQHLDAVPHNVARRRLCFAMMWPSAPSEITPLGSESVDLTTGVARRDRTRRKPTPGAFVEAVRL